MASPWRLICISSKHAEGKLAAIAVCGPFGAVKEQAAGLYAQTMAERGFLTIAFDPSFTGESGGQPRYMASPDINTEDFQAAVDHLCMREDVNPEKIGIIGICGWGGMALNAAALDTRIKATVASTMYDMARVNANGYFDAEDSEAARYEKKKALNASVSKTAGMALMPWAAAWQQKCQRTRLSMSKIITTITRRLAAIIHVL